MRIVQLFVLLLAFFITIALSMDEDIKEFSDEPGASSIGEPPRSLEEENQPFLDRKAELQAKWRDAAQRVRLATELYNKAKSYHKKVMMKWEKEQEQLFEKELKKVETSIARNNLHTEINEEDRPRKKHGKAIDNIVDRLAQIDLQIENQGEAGMSRKRRKEHR